MTIFASNIHIKRIYDPPNNNDGARILAARFRSLPPR